MFKEILKQTYEKTDGALMVTLLGLDGIPIEKYYGAEEPDFDEELFCAEYSTYLKNFNKTNENIKFGNTKEYLVRTDKYTIVINTVAEEYLIVSVINQDGNLGRARYENNKAALTLTDKI